MDDFENYCLQIYRAQGISDLMTSRGSYEIVLILREVALSSRPYVATQVIRMSPDGVL